MNWPPLPSRYSEIKTFVLLVAIVGSLAFLAIHFGNLPQQRANAGFGPDWECTGVGKGDPVCVKKTGVGK
jgi:hypothetical protein